MRESAYFVTPPWRLTAIVGAIAILGSAGVFAAVTLADFKSERPDAASDTAQPPSKDTTLAAAFASQKPDPQSYGWEFDFDWLKSGMPAAFVEDGKLAGPAEQPSVLVAAVPNAVPDQPVGPDRSVSVPDWADQTTTPALAGPFAQRPDRVRREHRYEAPRAAASKPHRLAMRPTYLERSVEEGDAGEVTFHVKRRACTPPHMVDVCYMPAENRRTIVVERY